jgi:hypothetical protein
MKPIYLFGLLTFVLCTGFLVLSVQPTADKRFNESKRNIIFREVGHRLLLQARDSTSRVLPVENIDDHEYRITFESPLSFIPDSLVQVVEELINSNQLPRDYIVSVVECGKQQVVFGYAMLNAEHRRIIPCADRQSPENCYTIIIQFKGEEKSTLPLYFGGSALLALTGMYFHQRKIKKCDAKKQPAEALGRSLSIGRYSFDSNNMFLELDGVRNSLSAKETKLLSIFVATPNIIIDRARLQKEVWEDEGVIVSRSLDMYISKLRKKLDGDPGVKLVNIHGRGYKLEIS